MMETTLDYIPADRELYRQGKLYSRWRRGRRKKTLFLEIDNEPGQRQFPVKCPPLTTQTYGFGELFAGVHFLNKGFTDVIRYHYYCHRDYDSYEKAIQILGLEVAEFICRPHPQPPDLLVVDNRGRFFFVEVKLPEDSLKPSQTAFFKKIESYLNRKVSERKKIPHRMPQRHWIEILRLKSK